MDETLVGDMHTLPYFAIDRKFLIIFSLIKHARKGHIIQSGYKRDKVHYVDREKDKYKEGMKPVFIL